MAENRGKRPSGHRKTGKSGHQLDTEKPLYPFAMGCRYNFHDFGCYLGKVGSNQLAKDTGPS